MHYYCELTETMETPLAVYCHQVKEHSSNNWFNISALQHISPKNREHCQACYSSNQHIHTYSVSIISN